MFDHMDMATVAVVIAMCPADIYGSTEAILGHFYLYHPNYNHHIFQPVFGMRVSLHTIFLHIRFISNSNLSIDARVRTISMHRTEYLCAE